MKEFSKKLLLEGGNAYFDQLSTTCDMAFDYIEDAATQKAEIGKYTADIQNFSEEKEEKERQKQEIQGGWTS